MLSFRTMGKKKEKMAFSEDQVVKALKGLQEETTGYIAIQIDKVCPKDVYTKAITVFEKLNLSNGSEKNAVLIYVATKSKRFAIVGDQAINELVAENFWEAVKDIMRMYFKRNDLTTGLLKGVKMIGKQLEKNFPRN